MRYYEIVSDIFERYADLGKLSPEELVKGQPLDPADPTSFNEVDARTFVRALTRIRSNDLAKANAGLPAKGLDTLQVYGVGEYAGMRCFLGRNNSSGFAIKKDELVSVFSTQRSSGRAIVASAIRNGARRLDCFALRQGGGITGPLYTLYAAHGFKIDTAMNHGAPGEPYAVVHGVSAFVDDAGRVHPEDPRVVVFMTR